ncbi:FliH/SctL family protein [Geotalea toluenoxydans]|uniref:FliH/SctL family protein n=1 Tax=Geotalea toluenoxydans TaxID=421624 RepID=UPI0006D0F48B|nr:FliH/SctL family protein [Geotalea toluenoxydans]
MSSSKIIKSIDDAGFMGFHFRELKGSADEPPAADNHNAPFTPVIPGAGAAADKEEVAGNAEEDTAGAVEEKIVVGIPEEEADRREQAAYNEGLREGKRQAEESLAKVSEALAKALLSTGGLRQKVMQESEEDLLKLAIVIARKIILQEISIDRRILVNIVKAAVSNVSDGDEVVVRLSPSDYEIVADHREFLPPANEKRRITLKADETIPGGGCLVETSMGAIDARIEAQLDEIFRRFMEDRSVTALEADTMETEGKTDAGEED